MSQGFISEHDEPQIHQTTVDKLVYMANQIADFFEGQGTRDLAVASTADHLKSFWHPNMFRDIFAHLDQAGGKGLTPIALDAVKKLQSAPPPGSIRAELANGGKPTSRAPGDDAG